MSSSIASPTALDLKNAQDHIEKAFAGQCPTDLALVTQCIDWLDSGACRANTFCTETNTWESHMWLRKAVLLFLKNTPATPMAGPWGGGFDKVGHKTHNWDEQDFQNAGFRLVPGAVVRKGTYIAKGAVLMPCVVNIGATIGANTMIDTYAHVGSCAHIGANCHLSMHVGIGGVLEPLQANPVIVEDNCFIGAGSQLVEGIHVGKGAVISMGVHISASTKIIDRATGNVTSGSIPPYAVVVPGTHGQGDVKLACAVIVKTVDAQTRNKVSINALLRSI